MRHRQLGTDGPLVSEVAPAYGLTAAETVLGKALHAIDRDPVCARHQGRPGRAVLPPGARRSPRALCPAAAAGQVHGAALAKLALPVSVTTSPYVSTVIGSASPANVRRNIAWIEEPLDDDPLATIKVILAPVRDQGWVSGRAGNQNPGGH